MIEEITKRLDTIVEKYLTKEGESYKEEFGYLRRTRFWPNKGEGKYEWYVMAELPPDYGSTTYRIFRYIETEEGTTKKGFIVNNDHVGTNMEKALKIFEKEIKKLKKRIKR